jgi:hypothetical protein
VIADNRDTALKVRKRLNVSALSVLYRPQP